jgi:hypothetical protein
MLPDPDKPEPNRFEDKKIDCVSEISGRKNTKIITKVLTVILRPKWPVGYVQVFREQGIEESNIPHFLKISQWILGFFASPTTRSFYVCLCLIFPMQLQGERKIKSS